MAKSLVARGYSLEVPKGADLLVEAFARLCRESGDAETHLVLAGPDDGEEQRLRRMVTRLKISDRATFTDQWLRRARYSGT